MSSIETLGQEVKRKRAELKEYYNNLIKEDEKLIDKEANEYVSNYNVDEDIEELIIKAYKDGWTKSLVQPLTHSIHLITMYAYDYIPSFISVDVKHTVSCIRDIFRQKLYPKNSEENED